MDFVSKNFDFSEKSSCKIIGEIGVNHNCDKDILFKLLDEGHRVGLDIIKLQRFIAAEEISTYAESADYQKKAGQGNNQLEMAKKLELPDEMLFKAYEFCKEKGIGFLCTAFDFSSVDFISKKLGCKSIKSPSPEITNKPLIQHMAKSFDGMIISTGASTMKECENVINWASVFGKKELCLMHCLSEYPAPIDQTNLKAIISMNKKFNLPIGYSDHTNDNIAAIVSVALGAKFIEKHYTLDKNLPGPDHQASLDINELKKLISSVKDAYESLVDGVKIPAKSEKKNRLLIRKRVVCNDKYI